VWRYRPVLLCFCRAPEGNEASDTASNQKRPAEGAVLDSFADVFENDGVGLGEVIDGAGDFEDAVVGAGRSGLVRS
jgi:hypothetical protein